MAENQFRRFRALGYESVLPVIAPFGEIDDRSSLKTSDLAHVLGKAPGVLWEKSGKWGGLPGWRTIIATDADADAWHEMGANTGLRLDAGLISIDIDVENEAAANDEEARAIELLGPSPCRVGAWPRRMLFYRIDAPTSSRNMRWFEGTEKRLVEVQTAGKQVVIAGTHRKTGKPYHWPRPMPPRGELSLISPALLSAWFADVRARHEGADEDVERKSRTDRNNVDQGGLRGDTATVQRAVEHLPNGFAHFPKRDDWIRVGYAIKGALSHEPDQGFSVWADWSDRYERATPEIYAKEWSGMKPPFELGASWLYDKAQELSGGTFTKASAMFENLGDEIPSLFTAPENATRDTFPLLTISDIENRPPLEWLVKRHIPRVSMGFLYSVPGAGKSFLALDMALTIASGAATWFGDAIGADNRNVVYIAAEGAYGFGDRIAAWKKTHGDAETAKNVGRNFLMLPATIAFMDRNDVEKLLRTVRDLGPGRRPCLVVVDTVSRMLPGADENLQKDMTLFIDACGAVRETFQCAVVGVHHAGKSGDMRGSTVLQGAGDFVFKLERNKKARVGTLHAEKQKDGADGWSDAYSFAPVVLGPERSSLVVTRTAVSITDALDDDGAPTARAADVLAAIGRAWSAGVPWSKGHQGKERYAVNHLIKMGFVRGDAEILLAKMLDDGLIEVATCGAKKHLEGYRVVENGQNVSEIDLFG